MTLDGVEVERGDLPEWLAGLAEENAVLVTGESVDGAEVFVDEENRLVYVEDCDAADVLTSEGGAYGPSGTEAGYASICPTRG